MTISKRTAFGAVAGILLLGVSIGRFTLPSKVVERDRIVTVDREVETTLHAYVGHTETRTDTKTQYQIITHWEKDGSISQTVAAVNEQVQSSKFDVSETETHVREVVKLQEVTHEKLVESKKPDWILGAHIGIDFDKRGPVYGTDISRRILGPVFLTGWGERLPANWAAGIGVKVEF
jgi:hypothetical protein